MSSETSNDSIRVLVVDDEEVFREMTAQTLNTKGFKVVTAASGEEGLEKLDSQFFDVVLLDILMPGMDGLELLRKLSAERPTQQVVMLTGHASISTAIEAMKLGAFDFLIKPAKLEDLMITIQRAAERGQMQRRTLVLETELQRSKGSGRIVGESQAVKKVLESIEKAALTDLPVLITGESGTGKELVARAIHAKSKRASHSLVVVDGSTLHEQLLASELFGHEKGAFTGAVSKKVGLFEVADRGSLFLDEIGDLSTPNQVALLRVIEYGTFRPLGTTKELHTDVRIIAATNKDIDKAVESGELREDLYYRLKGLTIDVPPLRERRTDIPLLAEYFLKQAIASVKTPVKLSKEALQALVSYNWPGNIRELSHVIQLAALFAIEEGEIKLRHLPEEIRKKKQGKSSMDGNLPQGSIQKDSNHDEENSLPQGESGTTLESLNEFRGRCEHGYIKKVLGQFDGNKSQASKVLGISRALLYKKLRLLGLD